MNRPNLRKTLLVFVLGFSSGLPMALLSSTLLAWYSVHQLSVIGIASLSLLGLPYILRVLWSPLLDRFYWSAIGRRRSWIVVCQILLVLGFNLLAWLSPATTPGTIAVLACILAVVSATQDTVIDAHRTEYLSPAWHGLGASVAVTAYRIALLVSGGLALVLAQHFGWAFMFQCMGLLLIPAMLATLCSTEPAHPPLAKLGLRQAFYMPLQELWRRPYCFSLVGFILLYKLGEAFTSSTSGIVMPFLIQGIGFSLDQIAYVHKIIGVLAIVVGGLLAGILLMVWPLYQALLCFGLLQAVTNALFVALAMLGANFPLFVVAVVADNLAVGMGTTALVALLMRIVDQRFTATQFSLLVALASLPRVLSGPFAGYLQLYFGWIGLYQLSVFFALLFLPFLSRLRHELGRCDSAQLEPA
ncbi:MAG: MFS transporter [Legionellaceae bacterium]|nr:MFS transporter [Legionellaceae bacterium]